MFPAKSKALLLLLAITTFSSASTVMSTDVVLSTYTPPIPSLVPPATSSVYKPVPTYAVTLCDDPACSKGNDHKLEIRTELNVCNRISHSAFFGGKGGIGGVSFPLLSGSSFPAPSFFKDHWLTCTSTRSHQALPVSSTPTHNATITSPNSRNGDQCKRDH